MPQLKYIKSPNNGGTRAEQLFNILFEFHHPLAFVSFRDALRVSTEYNWILDLIDEKPTVNTTVKGMFPYSRQQCMCIVVAMQVLIYFIFFEFPDL